MTEEQISYYKENPLLFLLECYILKCIDALPPHMEPTLQKLAPKLAEGQNLSGTWDEILSKFMEFQPGFSEYVNHLYEQRRALARKQLGEDLPPSVFARALVEQNFKVD